MPEHPERTALYRLFDANDRLLYVGISENPERRWQTHAYTARATWWPQVARKTVKWYDTRPDAADAELKAIGSERPLHNLAGVPSPLALSSHKATAGVRARAARKGDRRHAYEQVADALREAINAGEMATGDRLPSFSEIREHFGVTVTTAQRSLRMLKDEGLVEGRRGTGLFVCDFADRTITVPIGRPELAAVMLLEALAPEDRAELIRLLADPS